MNAHLINRAMSTATSTLFNRRPVSQMDEDQRKAVMARLSGGGYGGNARGGGSPARVATARLRRMSELETLRHQGQVGLDSDITPVDLMIGSGFEEAYAGLQKAKENAKNPWVTGALAAAGLGMLALGVRGNRKMVAKAAGNKSAQFSAAFKLNTGRAPTSREVDTFNRSLINKGNKAASVDDLVSDAIAEASARNNPNYPFLFRDKTERFRGASTEDLLEAVRNPNLYTKTQLEDAQSLLQVRGMTGTAGKAAGKKSGPAVRSFAWDKADLFRKADGYVDTSALEGFTRSRGFNISKADSDYIRSLRVKGSSGIDEAFIRANYPQTTPASPTGDAFRRAAEQATGSRRGQFLDYARRADIEAVAPRIVRDPWTSTRATIGNLNLGNRKDQTMTASLQLISNAIRVITIPDEILISNAPRMAMTDEQRKAMFSRKSSGYGGATARGRRPQPANNPLSGTPANYAPIASRTGEPGRPVLEQHRPRSSSPDYLSRHADGPRPNHQNFERFDTAWQTYINANPRHRDSGVYSQINGLLGAIRSGNATPQQLGHLEQLVGISLQPFRIDAPGAWDSERVLQSTMLSSALGVLQNANRLTHYEPFNRVSNNPGITFHSHLTNYEHDPYARYGSGTNFSMNRPAMPNLPVTRTTASGTTSQGLSDAPRTGPGRTTPPAYATTSGPNNSITTDMNGNVLSATNSNAPRPPPPGTPRTDPYGRQYYGPRPEEPGYIDHRGWRRGAEPAQPSRPAPPGIIDRR